MSGNITQGFGFNKGGSSGGGGTNTNIANADLTSDGNHTLDVAATTLTIDSGAVDMAKFNGTTNKITFGPSGDDYTFPDERPGATGDVLSAADTSGNLEWITPTPNTNTNVANADLTLDANHTTDVGANTLTFDSGATNIAQLVGGDNTLSIGGANPYKMPTARLGTAGGVIQSTNTTTGTAWVRNGFTLPFRLYLDGVGNFNYYYPEPMTNNKALALASDAGANAVGSLSFTTPNVLRRSLALPGGAGISIRDISFWGSCVDNVASTTPQIEVNIVQTTPIQANTANLGVTSVIDATTTGSGDNNSRLYRATKSLATPVDVGQYSFIIPMFKLIVEEAPEEINYDVYINGSISGYYTA